jgi:hypothetical protein
MLPGIACVRASRLEQDFVQDIQELLARLGHVDVMVCCLWSARGIEMIAASVSGF